jgi:hypothetical protein
MFAGRYSYMAVQFMADPRPTFAQNPAASPPPYD